MPAIPSVLILVKETLGVWTPLVSCSVMSLKDVTKNATMSWSSAIEATGATGATCAAIFNQFGDDGGCLVKGSSGWKNNVVCLCV